jgi:hypothetical protein
MNKFKEFFYTEPKKNSIHKWEHYFDIYEKHFNKFIGKNPKILEIGISGGGSLDMWNYYFDNKCEIYGLDILPINKEFPSNVHIFQGDQGDSNFWDSFLKDHNNFDIVIDDGGHLMNQQIVSFEKIYPKLNDNGVYLCEDTHTSYMEGYGGKLKGDNTFIEYSKKFIDLLHAYYNNLPIDFRKNTFCVSYYDSIVVLDKKLDNLVSNALIMG